jgi:hypothetical protein
MNFSSPRIVLGRNRQNFTPMYNKDRLIIMHVRLHCNPLALYYYYYYTGIIIINLLLLHRLSYFVVCSLIIFVYFYVLVLTL